MTLEELLARITGPQPEPGGPPRRTALGTASLNPGMGMDHVFGGALAGGREAMLRADPRYRDAPSAPGSRMGAMVGQQGALRDTQRPIVPPDYTSAGPMGPGGVTGEAIPWEQLPQAPRVPFSALAAAPPTVDMAAGDSVGGPLGHRAFAPFDAPGMPEGDDLDAAWNAALSRVQGRQAKPPQRLTDMRRGVESARARAAAREYVARDVERQGRVVPRQPPAPPLVIGPGGVLPRNGGR